MRITIDTAPYNPRRYGKPWIAKVVSWEPGKRAEIEFGAYLGEHGCAGQSEIMAEPGDIIRHGQKDHRTTRPWEGNGWAIAAMDGSLEDCTEAEAKTAYLAKQKAQNQPQPSANLERPVSLESYTDAELLAEIERRGLTQEDTSQ